MEVHGDLFQSRINRSDDILLRYKMFRNGD